MIMAHNNKEQLKVLLSLLDDANNEIYLHIDAKAEMTGEGLENVLKKSKLHVYKKEKIYWSDISIAKCQLLLVKEASKTYHDYYHLLSGADLPLKTNAEIDAFFEKCNGKQLINFDRQGPSEHYSCKYVHPFQPFIIKNKEAHRKNMVILCYWLGKRCVDLQKLLGLTTGCGRGSNWNDITHELAVDYAAHEKVLVKKLRNIFCADESILQTYYLKYGQKFELYGTDPNYKGSILREIDWARGNGSSPYTFRIDDYDMLMKSDMLYARKFDWNTDKEIILKIRDTLLNKQ